MSLKRCNSLSETRIEKHLNLIKELETKPLADSCCDICHCDCYNSHRSDSYECCISKKDTREDIKTLDSSRKEVYHTKFRKKKCASNSLQKKATTKSKQLSNETKLPNGNLNPKNIDLPKKPKVRKRSKSVALQRSQSQRSDHYYTRDCEILHDLLTSLDDKCLANLEVIGKSADIKKDLNENDKDLMVTTARSSETLTVPENHNLISYVDGTDSSFVPIRLSESMANLCLAPTIKEAYNTVPDHDKRILNRMATKRSEQALAKENAWLARKYWENERYERELFKCEQMEEYKKAVRDKQFQDYLQTKARLNEIAKRDLAELQRLKESIQDKDDRTKKRLQSLRNDRNLSVNQKRFEEMQKMECVNLHQEEQFLGEMVRKSETCQRLTERLKRADHVRSKMLENYLKRVRYDNYIEQLQHEEHFREIQLNEQIKREQLKEEICRKRCRSQYFLETKQQRNESLRKTAKLSKSLRDIVRSSITPEAGVALFGTSGINNSQNSLSKLILNRPF